MKDDVAADIVRPATGDSPATLGAEAAEHERQLRELLEFSPAAIGIVDEAGRLLFHNVRLREIFGYSQSEFHLFDTRLLWHDLDQRERIIEQLRIRGGQVLNEKVI
jgi:PAS domain S-box-containing protein